MKHSSSLLMSALALACATALPAHAEEKARIAFVPQIIGIPYFNAMEAGGHRAAEDLGAEFIYEGPVDSNPIDQLQIVQSLISRGVDAVSVSVLDASSLAPVAAEAEEKNIKLFTSDSDAPDSGRAVFVAQASDEGLGYSMIDELVARAGEDATIAIVSGEPTASNLNTWIGFMQKRVESEYPNVTLLEPQYAGGTSQRAAQITTDLMSSNAELDGVIAVASVTCSGVAQAIETASRVGEVIGAGYCSPNTARSYLESGAFGFTVLWDPEALGYLTVWAGKQLIDGNSFSAENSIEGLDSPVSYDEETGVLLLGPPTVFTKENVGNFDF